MDIKVWLQNNKWLAVSATLATVLLFTPYYSVAAIAILLYASHKRAHDFLFLDTFVARFIVNILVFSAITMGAGLYCWALHIPFAPVYPAVIFGLFYYFFIGRQKSLVGKFTFINLRDTLSLAVALAPMLLMFGSFYLPHPGTAATFQQLANGYDNIAHYSLFESDYQANGYVYGKFSAVKYQLITPSGDYPQGWHFANAMFIKGFGVNIFAHNHLLLAINLYSLLVISWYVIAVYIFARAGMVVYDLATKRQNQRYSFGTICALCCGSLLIQLLVYVGSWWLGFASFLPTLAYFTLVTLLCIYTRPKSSYNTFTILLICLSTVAITATWLLPLPAVMLTLLLVFLSLAKRAPLRSYLVRKYLLRAMVFALALIPTLIQVYAHFAYASTSTSFLLKHDGGIFGISNLLVSLIIVFTIAFFVYNVPRDKGRSVSKLIDDLTIVAGPMFILSGGIFIYQTLTTNTATYYFVKVFALAIAVLGVFFTAAYAASLEKVKFSNNASLLLGVLSFSTFIVIVAATGQTTSALSSLFQWPNSKLSVPTTVELAKLVNDGSIFKYQVVFVGGHSDAEDYVATYFADRMTHQYNYGACEWRVSPGIPRSMKKRIAGLQYCADTEHDNILVLSSDKTYPALNKMASPNIHVVDIDKP